MQRHSRRQGPARRRRRFVVACRAWRAWYQRAGPSALELHPHCELNRTRTADLIQRAEAATLSPASQRAVQHLRGVAELRRGEVVDRTSKIRMVQDVEHVHSSLQGKATRHAELTAQRQI